ncbi:MAG TPA: glycoside hydrolase family 3 N-terminal domain-containing protein, partial [Egibacteraceae bacterium]|nr:glycoside hydrolase family 3 N-terminal domain-containing protein [Egibacteraceae bacterium]
MRWDLPPLVAGFALGLAAVLALGAAQPSAQRAAAGAQLPSARPAPADPGCQVAAERLAGEVLVAGLPGVLAPNHPLVADLVNLQVGGVLIEKSNVRNAAQVRRLVGAMRDGSDRPLLVTTDEETGRVSNFGEVLGRFSAARTLAKRGSPADVERFARQLGVELANLGMDVVFAPVADVDDGPATGMIGDRSFSGDPEEAGAYALAYARGLWSGGVLPAPKHFPGAGRARAPAAGELPRVDAAPGELRGHDLGPFRAQIRAGVRMLMVGNVVVEAVDPQQPVRGRR